MTTDRQIRAGVESRYQLLELIAVLESRGFPPTLRELAVEMGFSVSTIQFHLATLRDEGLVTWLPFQSRTLRLTSMGREVIA